MQKRQLINTIYYFAALLILAGILAKLSAYENAPFIYLAGTALYAVSRALYVIILKPERRNRIPQIQIFASICLVASAYFMLKESNSWSLFLFIAAVIEIYTSFRTKDQ